LKIHNIRFSRKTKLQLFIKTFAERFA
jgi:hypothetical protein